MLKIIKMSPRYEDQVSCLSVNDEQKVFVSTVAGILDAANQHVHVHLILKGDSVIGIFLIDLNYPRTYDFAPDGCLGLRSYMIDSRYQGHGYGKQAIAILPGYLNQNYPAHSQIYLTVNCKNPAARSCYLKSGFVDTQQLYLGGQAGPQHIMKLAFA